MNIEKEKKIMKIYDFITYTIMILMMILCLRHIILITHATSVSDKEYYYNINGTNVPGINKDNFIILQRNTTGGNSLNGTYYLVYLDSRYDYKVSTDYESDDPTTNFQVYKNGSYVFTTQLKDDGTIFKLVNEDGTTYKDSKTYLYLSDSYVPSENPEYGEDNGTYWSAVPDGEGLGDLRIVYCNSKEWSISKTDGYLEQSDDFFLCPRLVGLATIVAGLDLQTLSSVICLAPLVICLVALVAGWYKAWNLLQQHLRKA